MSGTAGQKDHMLLPKATLMRFIDENDVRRRMPVLNLFEDKRYRKNQSSPGNGFAISYIAPRNFHTQKNYYLPSVDAEVKRYETMLGRMNQMVSEAVAANDFSCIDMAEIKNNIMRIFTLQIHRFILVDEAMQKKFYSDRKKQYDDISLSCIMQAKPLPSDFLSFKKSFEKAKSNFGPFFQKHFLMNPNDGIEAQYADFHAVILSIPADVPASFLLPPQHVIGLKETVRIILAPRLAVALYPGAQQEVHHSLTKEEADALILRSIESACELNDPQFRQLVGKRAYLEEVLERIAFYRRLIQSTGKPTEYRMTLAPDGGIDQSFEAIIMLRLLHPNAERFTLSVPASVDMSGIRDLAQRFSYNSLVISVEEQDTSKVPIPG